MAPSPPSFAHRGRKRKQVAHYTDDNPSTFTTKHKRGEKPVESPLKQNSLPKSVTTPSRRKRPMETAKPEETSVNDDTMIVHEHAMRIQPILPSSMVANVNETGNVIYGAGLGPPRPLAKPEWQLVNTPHMLAVSEFVKRKKTLPPRIICMHTFGNYLVLGDSLGQVLVYTLHPLVLHVATISTTASARAKPKPSLKRPSEQDAILCICMQGEYIMIATSSEIEAYHAIDQSRVWTYPLEERAHVTKLDVHATTHNVLAGVCSNDDASISPLWLLTHDKSSGEVTATKDILPSSSVLRCAGMWDRSSADRFVVVTTPFNDEEVPQVLLTQYNADSESFATLACAKMPQTRANKAIESISQSPLGTYTIVASSKGVRLYETSSLKLVHVYGEGLNLHGHGLVYQQGCVISEFPEDEYQNGAGVFIMGVPHAHREPREVQEDLHIWQWWDTLHPSAVIKGPPRSLGLSQVWSASPDMILALTHAGDVWMLSPTASTDWPGVMYPPGYHVIDDNLVYIEDEDELDQVIETVEDDDVEHETLDDELAEVLRISMLEATSAAVKEEEAVLVANPKGEETKIVIPCHPDPELKDAVQQGLGVSSPVRSAKGDALPPACFLRQILATMPTRVKMDNGFGGRGVKALEAKTNSSVKPVRGKRSRAGNLEAMIRASIDPKLQKFMTSKEQSANGKGSTLRDCDKVSREDVVPTQCAVKNEETGSIKSTPASMGTIEQTQGNAAQSQINVSTNYIESMNGGSVEATATTSSDQNSDDNVAKIAFSISEVAASRPMDDAATSALEGLLGLQRSLSEDISPKKIVPPVPEFDCKPAAVVTERAVVSDSAQAMEIDDSGSAQNEASVVPTKVNTEEPTEPEKHVVSHSEGSSPLPALGPPAETAPQGTDGILDSQASESIVPSPDFCSACRGRMVIHTCGKREVPVDVEAIERAEKEKLEREAEEKKKLRAEKRRQADARRREARKNKKLEEARLKRIEEERLKREQEEMERLRKQAEARLTSEDHQERDRRRAEMWQRLMAANGGGREEERDEAQTNQNTNVAIETAQSTYGFIPVEQQASLGQAQVQPSYRQSEGTEQSNDSYVQQQSQQPYYHQSYKQAAAFQGSYRSQQEQRPPDCQADVHAPAGRPANFAASSPNLQQNSGQVQSAYDTVSSTFQTLASEETVVQQEKEQQHTVAFQSQQPNLAISQSVAASQALVHGSQQQASSPFDPQTQTGYQEQEEPPRPGLLERRTSAQLGTAEALASLASMCVQMPRAPTPLPTQPSPHSSEGNNGGAVFTSRESQAQSPFNSSSVVESAVHSRSTLDFDQANDSTTTFIDGFHSVANGAPSPRESNGGNAYVDTTTSVAKDAPVKVTPFTSSPQSTSIAGQSDSVIQRIVVGSAESTTNEGTVQTILATAKVAADIGVSETPTTNGTQEGQ